MPKRLLVLAGPDEGRTFEIPAGGNLLIGRSRATDTRLIDPHVERVHCQLQTDGADVFLDDFDSAGGTFVNGKRVGRKYKVQTGDLLRIGNTRLQFIDEEADNFAVAPPVQAAPSAKEPWYNLIVGKKISNFRIGPILAKGQSGYIFHARDIRNDVPVALKVLEPEFARDVKARQRFVKAMETVLPLSHPNLIRVYAAGKKGPFCWVAMEYFPGESLAAIIGRIAVAGHLDWRKVLRLAINMARALTYAHERGLVHRNITPQNILIGRNASESKLTDLMLATAMEGYLYKQLSRKSNLLVDIPYMAPERTAAKGEVDVRADLYSLGAVLYASLTGQPPFGGETITELVTHIRRVEPIALADLHLGVPDLFDHVIFRLLRKNPQDRYQNAKDLLGDLERIAEHDKVAAG
jgi:serine/threonine protein kinase